MDILKGLFKEFGWFINLLIGLGLLWFFMGGYMSETAREGPYLKPPAPLDTGEAYGGKYVSPGTGEKAVLDRPDSAGTVIRNMQDNVIDFLEQSRDAIKLQESPLVSKSLYIDGTDGAKAKDAQKEYVIIASSQSMKGVATITGLTLGGTGYGITARLPQAASLPVLGTAYKLTDVAVPANSRIIVSSGRSPIGTSFRANICTGYLGQFQSYVPTLTEACPEPLTELAAAGLSGDASCKAFVEDIPRCRAYNGSFPADVSASCRAFVTGRLNYNSCVANNSGKTGFYTNEWRLFLEEKDELWKQKREVIRLFDKSGVAIDAVTY